MVAAFGSRPCGVLAAERTQVPLIVGVRARDVGIANAGSRDPAALSIGSIVPTGTAVRAPTSSAGGNASVAWLEALGARDTHSATSASSI